MTAARGERSVRASRYAGTLRTGKARGARWSETGTAISSSASFVSQATNDHEVLGAIVNGEQGHSDHKFIALIERLGTMQRLVVSGDRPIRSRTHPPEHIVRRTENRRTHIDFA